MARPPESEMSVYARMCGLKKKYASHMEATQNGSRVYRCPYCKGFHRTTQQLNRKRRRRQRATT
jgi:hypothetical protein